MPFHNLTKKHDMIHFATGNNVKASVVERFNHILKTQMWRYYMAYNTGRYVDIVQDLLCAYNNTYHSTIKMKPNEVNTQNASPVFNNIYSLVLSTSKKHRYKSNVRDKIFQVEKIVIVMW